MWGSAGIKVFRPELGLIVGRYRWRDLAADTAVAAVVTAIMIIAATESGDVPARPVDAWVVLAIAMIGAWSAIARRAPRTGLVGAGVTFFTALIFGIPAFSPALALGVPVFMVARAGHLWWGVAAPSVVVVTGTPYRLAGPGAEPVGQVALSTLFDLSLLAVLLLLGETLRSRRALREEADLRLRLAAQEHENRITDERIRTARDLHDVLSHTLALVGIQANVAAESMDLAPERARRAVEQVRLASREAVSDLRSTIAVLRDDAAAGGGTAPAPGLAQLPALVEAVRAAGLTATLTLRGDPVPLRTAVELAVYRVVQESLTNTLRHSGAGSVEVLIERDPEQVRVEVRDDGRAGPVTRRAGDLRSAGSGLRGMVERVSALGGTLSFGDAGDGARGFTVRAQLPAGGVR
jgi:signal transduction histidine kinase